MTENGVQIWNRCTRPIAQGLAREQKLQRESGVQMHQMGPKKGGGGDEADQVDGSVGVHIRHAAYSLRRGGLLLRRGLTVAEDRSIGTTAGGRAGEGRER